MDYIIIFKDVPGLIPHTFPDIIHLEYPQHPTGTAPFSTLPTRRRRRPWRAARRVVVVVAAAAAAAAAVVVVIGVVALVVAWEGVVVAALVSRMWRQRPRQATSGRIMPPKTTSATAS